MGLTQGALGLGGLMGGLLASGLGARLRLHHSPLLLLLASGGVVLMGVALLPLVSPIVGYGLITVLSFLVMGVSTLFTVTILAAMQGQTPPDLLGKVMARCWLRPTAPNPWDRRSMVCCLRDWRTTPGQ